MRKIFLPLMLLLFILSGCGGEKDPGNVNSMKHNRQIIVGIDDEYPPMGFRNDKGEIVGFDVDLAKEAAKRMGVQVEFKPINWGNKEKELDSANIDLIWNGLDITPERKERILYSKPYMDNRQILLVKKDSAFDIYSEYDLAGKVVGTQYGSNSRDYIEENKELKNSLKEFKTYVSFKEAFLDLAIGEIEVLIVDELAGRYEMNKQPFKFDVIDVTIGPVTEIGIGFAKNNTELRDKVQTVFDSMIKDGTAQQISKNWFQADLIKSHI